MSQFYEEKNFLTTEIIIELYKSGIFLMAKKRTDNNVFFFKS